ncbi:MAG: LamG domain-containing protein [Actinobacteria bacterium]|nr:LamG domain-containing protein [Actinomycetota bacterium]
MVDKNRVFLEGLQHRRSMAVRLISMCALLSVSVGSHISQSAGLFTATRIGPQVSISTWTACSPDAYRLAVLGTTPQAYLRMTPTGLLERSVGSNTSDWTWTAAPTTTPGALGCDSNLATILSASAWLSSEHRVWTLGDTVSFSYALWFKANVGTQGVLFSSASGVASSGATSRADRALWIAPNGVLSVSVTDGPVTKWISTPGTVADGKWHFAVVTMQSGDSGATRGTRLYLDGAQVAYDSQMRKGLPPTSTESWRAGPATLPTAVGTLAPTSAFTGALDEIAVWDKVVTDAQISSIWAARNG